MSVADCLSRAVVAGTVKQKDADSALRMHQRMQREFTAEAAPASADAASALAAARALRAQSAAKIRNAQAQVSAFHNAEQRLAEHPMGAHAGLMGMITRDMWRDATAFRDLPDASLVKQGPNVEGKYRSISRTLFGKFSAGMEQLKPGFRGSTDRQLNAVDNMIRELKGVDTGDQIAKAAAGGFKQASDYAVQRAQAAGKIFTPLEDWATPQFWRDWRTRDIGMPTFKADILQEIRRGGLTVWDRDTGKPVTAALTDDVLTRAFKDITGSGNGASAPFSKDQRTFVFSQNSAGAESWLRLQKKYGPGTNIMQMMVGHLDRMAHQIGLMETFGPSYEANFRALLKQAGRVTEIPTSAIGKWNPARMIAAFMEHPNAIEGAWKVATGQAHATHDSFIGGLLGALRNMNVASSLRQAVFSVLPTDSVTQLLAANHLGMDGIGHMARVFGGGVSKEDATHLALQGHNVMDFVNGIRDYDDHISMMQATGKFSSGVVRATGLDAWGQVGKRTWAGDMLNLFASQSGKDWAALGQASPKFRDFLSAYGFTPAEWDTLRTGAMMDLRGARYLDPTALQTADRGLYERVMNAIDEQGAFAMHQPDFRLRGIETGAAFGASPGLAMDFWRSFMQFKTFALSRMTTQMMRVFTDGDPAKRILRGLAFTTLSTAAGAATLQALNVINGKDPERMDAPGFWARAMTKGGAAGYYGELLDAALRGDRSSSDIVAAFGGPTVSMMADLTKFGVAPIREEFSDTQNVRTGTKGREAINVLRRWTPSTWWSRLAVDRLFWDKLQTLVDPDYRASWDRIEQRQQKNFGGGFWWGPGESAPTRLPQYGGSP